MSSPVSAASAAAPISRAAPRYPDEEEKTPQVQLEIGDLITNCNAAETNPARRGNWNLGWISIFHEDPAVRALAQDLFRRSQLS